MAATYHDGPSSDDDTDIGTLWEEALIRYYEECGTDLRDLSPSRLNMEHIKAEQEHQLRVFSSYRHDGGKLDKLRSLVVTNSDIVVGVATHIANAASAAFPPSAAILTAFNYVMNASRAVSDDYDMILSFFDVMNSFLERVSMLESRMPAEKPFRRFLVNVFSAMMTLSAIARKCRLKGRLSRWAKALIDGSDPKLKGAFDALHMHLQRFESATMLTTLKHTLDSERKVDLVGRDVKLIQAGVEQNIILSQQNYALGLESKGHAIDAATTSHEILTVVTRQDERGAEYTSGLRQVMKTLNKMSKTEGAQDQVVDAGSRKSMAMRTLQSLMGGNLDDKADFADLGSRYVDGTFGWFRTQAVFSGFEAGDVRLLWVSGLEGMGKSTLAYTAVKALEEEFRGETTTSVAHFFFQEEGSRVYVRDMLRSCALQIASRDSGYREEAVADVQRHLKVPGASTFEFSIMGNPSVIWETLFQGKFTKKSGRRLVLVLDGVDEVLETERKHIEMMLEVVSCSEDMNVQVLFTSDPRIFTPGPAASKVQVFEMTKEVLLLDIRAIIIGRLKSLDRLRKLPQRTRNIIVAKISNNADTLRYVDHMLRRLNQLGIEISVLRQLSALPPGTTELYKTILDDCQKARTDEEIATLRRFFAWLAYTTDTLFLSCASRLLRHIAPDSSISIEEEIENRCAGILSLSDIGIGRGDEEEEVNQYESESDLLSDPGTYNFEDDELIDDEEREEVGFAIVGFREKGIRSYFRAVGNPTGDRLRSSASSAHVMVLETIRSILCTESRARVHYRDYVLQSYAAKGWGRHLRAINQEDLSEEETACVIESICSILSNKGGSIWRMESGCYQMWNPETGLSCVLGETEEAIQETLACLQTWAARAASISPSSISSTTVAWISPFAQNPEAILIKLAETHVANWFASNSREGDDDNTLVRFLFAHYALYLGREHPAVQQNEELNRYFAGRHGRGDPSEVPVSEEFFIAVSRAFPHIEMTAQSYLSVAVSMLRQSLLQLALKQLEIAIRHASTDVESMEIYMRIANTRLTLARQSRPMIEESETGSETVDDDVSDGGDEPEADACSGDDGEATAGEGKKSSAPMDNYWGKEALEAITKAAELASNLPASALEDTNVREVVRDVWTKKAEAALAEGDSTNTITYCRRVMQACKKNEVPMSFDILHPLAKARNWSVFLEVVKVFSAGLVDGASLYLQQYTHEMHSAAKATGEIEYVLEQYRGAVQPGYGIGGMHPSVLINWARFYRDVVGTVEATSKAKALLARAMNTERSTHYIAEVSFRLSDILLEEFRRSTEPKEKLAVYSEMQSLVSRVSESMGAEFDPSQSQTGIPLAHMARKMNAVEFQKGLERTFEGCVAALTDETAWNDMLGLRTLARVLALVGLKREAQIAATCQLYVLNSEIHKRENEWRMNLDHGNTEGSEGNEEDDAEEGQQQSEEGGREIGAYEVAMEGNVDCEGCNEQIHEWDSGAVYLCYYCAETHLCQECFDKRAERILGKPSDNWQVLCPEGHRHIRIPVQGWGGMVGGVFTIDDTEVSFREWLTEVKEKRWPEVWERFWSEEQ